MKYIDLFLKKIDEKDHQVYLLQEAIKENKINVVLGAPGSGKTSLLKKFEIDNEDTQFLSIKRYIKFKKKIDDSVKILLLDGLDEYRSTSNDKVIVAEELGDKISELLEVNNSLKIIITCREMDWYGDTDETALKDMMNEKVSIFKVQGLDLKQQNDLAEILEIDDKEKFIRKFTGKGFLDNPQMFCMLSEIWKDDRENIGSKSNLYKKFISKSREENETHKQFGYDIEPEKQLEVAGYLALYYMFCEIDSFDEELIDEVASEGNGYSKDLINQILKTKIFSEKQFIHRTIAEYAAANYLANYKLSSTSLIGKERVKNLFIKKGKIPTELRGVYAWLCSLCGDQSFIEVDPYYQAVHGDNSIFNAEDKKKIIRTVRKYSKDNPYFYKYDHKMELEGFYTKELDDILIEEYNEGLKLNNDFIYFVLNIICQGKETSDRIKVFAKEKLVDDNIPVHYKQDFINILKSEIVYLKGILDKIKSGKLSDANNLLKERILSILYPLYLDYTQVADYLVLYKSNTIGHCYYLHKTAYKEKFELVNRIYELSYDKERKSSPKIPGPVKSFIKDYFLETILKYDDELSAEEIYFIIEYFNNYYPEYYGIEIESYRYSLTDKVEKSEEKLQRLTNKLFEIFLDKVLEQESDTLRVSLVPYHFKYFFTYKFPNNIGTVLLSRINKKLKREINIQLFLAGLNYLKNEENSIYSIEKLIIEYDLKEEYENWLNPEKDEWEIEQEKRIKEEKEKSVEIKNKNEAYFSDKSDAEIQKNFGNLNGISKLFHFKDKDNEENEKYLESQTISRLKRILKRLIYSDLIEPELLTLNSLAKYSPNVSRNIDRVYYTSLALNKGEEINIENKELKKYLYISALHHSEIGNVIESDFIKQVEIKDSGFVESTLKEYAELLLEEQLPAVKNILKSYTEEQFSMKFSKKIAKCYASNLSDVKNFILKNFFETYAFALKISDLVELKSFEMSDENENIIKALIAFGKNEREKFLMDMSVSIHELIQDSNSERYNDFKKYDSALKVKVIDYMMHPFNTEESIKREEGLQTPKLQCASFLTQQAIEFLSLEELEKLSELHLNDIWNNRILDKINEIKQRESDVEHSSYEVKKIKEFILDNTILSTNDFFNEVVLKIKGLKEEIEDNIYNDKKLFYHDVKEGNKIIDKRKKTEEDSRDIVLTRLKDKYGDELSLTKEMHIADNRVDINIKYKQNPAYEVQVECKRDDNKDLYDGIPNQLIKKYFSSEVQYGIYLIFYFGKENKELMLKKLVESIPGGYEDKIKIICIDIKL